ncbi:MAG: hypothetical protein ACOCRX_06795 [Candidatus Woesearchaeota archaeon]
MAIAVFLFTGFFWGSSRGALRSFLRLLFLVVNIFILIAVTPYIADKILNVDFSSLFIITKDGLEFTTLNEYTDYLISNNGTIAQVSDLNPTLAALVENLPKVVMNFAIFISGFFLLKILTLPLYSKLIKKTVDTAEIKTNSNGKEKKSFINKALGGIFGLVQAGITSMILFLPLTAVGLYMGEELPTPLLKAQEISQAKQEMVLNSEEKAFMNGSENEQDSESDEEGIDLDTFFGLYYDSILPTAIKTTNLTGLNNLILNEISSITVEGKRISIVQELGTLRSITEQTNDIIHPHDIYNINQLSNEEMAEILTDLEHKELENLANKLFELESFNLLGDDILSYINDNFLPEDEVIEDEDLDKKNKLMLNLMSSIKTSDAKLFKQDVLDIVDMSEILYENGLNTLFDDENFNSLIFDLVDDENNDAEVSDLTDIATSKFIDNVHSLDRFEVKEDVIDKIFDKDITRRVTIDGINYLTETINNKQDLDIEYIQDKQIDWEQEKSYLSDFIYNLTQGVYPIYKDQTDEEYNLSKNVKDLQLDKIGVSLDALQSSSIFTNIYSQGIPQIISKHSNTDDTTFEYIDLENHDWQHDFEKINDFVQDIYLQINGESIIDLNNSISNLNELMELKLVKEAYYQLNAFIFDKIEEVDPKILENEIYNQAFNKAKDLTYSELNQELVSGLKLANLGINISAGLNGNEEEAMENLEKIEYFDVETMTDEIIQTQVLKSFMFGYMNEAIKDLNEQKDINIEEFNINKLTLSQSESTDLARALYHFKDFYLKEFDFIESIYNTDNGLGVETLLPLKDVETSSLGKSLNYLTSISAFESVYVSLFNQTIFNEDFLNSSIEKEKNKINHDLNVDTTEIKNINWENELSMVSDVFGLLSELLDESPRDVIVDKTNSLFTNHGENVLLNVGFDGIVMYFFPEVEEKTMDNLQIYDIKDTLTGLVNLAAIIKEFENDPVDVQPSETYKIRTAIKSFESNRELNTLIKQITGEDYIDFSELSNIVDLIHDFVEFRKVSVNEIDKYLKYQSLVKPFMELSDEYDFSLSSIFGDEDPRMPYKLNVYAEKFGAKANIYNTHIGEKLQESRNNPDETNETLLDESADFIKYLKYTPGFVYMQLEYDENFELD